MTRVDFFRSLADLGRGLAAPRVPRTEFLAKLVLHGREIIDADRAGVAAFEMRFMLQKHRLREVFLGRSARRRKELPPQRRRQLHVLGSELDIMGPLGRLRRETLHTQALAWVLTPKRRFFDQLPANALRQRLSGLLEARGELPLDLTAELVTVDSEVSIPSGRVDLVLRTTVEEIFIELKVDAPEGKDQLGRYQNDLDARCQSSGLRGVLVFVPVDADSEPSIDVPICSLRGVLRDLLDISVRSDSPEHLYLRAYVKSLGMVCGVATAGDFDSWSFSARAAALDFLEEDSFA